MIDELLALGLGYSLVQATLRSMRFLPLARWQFVAAIPVKDTGQHAWKSVNLTFYGLIIALSVVASLLLAIFLLAAAAIPMGATLLILALLLIAGIAASKVITRLVEGHANGFTVGGAAFIGVILAPFVTLWVEHVWQAVFKQEFLITPILAALSLAYILGEGLGRLACISYGCCYGKRLATCPPWIQTLLGSWSLKFSSPTKKAVYESGFSNCELVPIQAMTAMLYSILAAAGVYLFLKGLFVPVFVLTLIPAFAWRFASEFLRADYRGKGLFSAYQLMSLAVIPYTLITAWVLRGLPGLKPDAITGLQALWSPGILLVLECVGLLVFIIFGKSTVTDSTVTFHLVDRAEHARATCDQQNIAPLRECSIGGDTPNDI